MSRSRKAFAVGFISIYAGMLCWGIMAHTLKVGLCGNTLSYYFVWDMFCGWSAWDERVHIIAEGSSGRYYDVREPWGSFRPFGEVSRINYDLSNFLAPEHIRHVLAHSAHEPIDRVFFVQEVWPKQYNLPDEVWADYYAEPAERTSYYHLRAICRSDGTPIEVFPAWLDQATLNTVADNPRLQNEVRQAQNSFNTLYTPRNSDGSAQPAFITGMAADTLTN